VSYRRLPVTLKLIEIRGLRIWDRGAWERTAVAQIRRNVAKRWMAKKCGLVMLFA
jgi:hypothetical protein